MPRSFLEVTRLTKTYDGVKAVQDASLVMGEGEFIGLIGPNGGGKRTFSGLISESCARVAAQLFSVVRKLLIGCRSAVRALGLP